MGVHNANLMTQGQEQYKADDWYRRRVIDLCILRMGMSRDAATRYVQAKLKWICPSQLYLHFTVQYPDEYRPALR